MKQNILRKLLLIAVLLTGVNAFAHDFEAQNSDGVTIYYNITSASDLTVGVTYEGSYYSYSNEYSGQVAIPKTVTYNSKTYSVTSIGSSTFRECSNLTSITIPNSVTGIGNSAFRGCSDLTSVNISDLEAWCKIVLSDGDSQPLTYAKNLYLNGELLTNIEIPNTITEIKHGAFFCYSSLTSITIPNSVTSIGINTFSGCGLTNVIIPNSVTSIGSYAFSGCNGLKSVTIGNSVTSIGDGVFNYCNGLTEITSKNSTPPTAYSNTFSNVPTTATLYVPIGSKEAYASADYWKVFTNIVEKEFIEETTVTIKDASNQGSLVIKHEVGKAFEFMAVPVAGCVVNAVLVNGEEIIADENGTYKIESVSDETIISVSYEIDSATSINTLNANNIKVYGYDNTLTVLGAENGGNISVFDMNGKLITSQKAFGENDTISLDNDGLYIVKVGNKSFKVIL